MKGGQGFFLQKRIHVNEHIAATDEVHFSEGWIFQKIVGRKHTHIPYAFIHLIATMGFHKVFFEHGIRHTMHFCFGVLAQPGLADCHFGYIGSENLYPYPFIGGIGF